MIRLYSVQVVTRMGGIWAGVGIQGDASLLIRGCPAGDLLRGQVAVGPDAGVAKASAEHVAQVLRPREEGAVADRLLGVGAIDLGVRAVRSSSSHHPRRHPGALARKDEAEQNQVGQQHPPVRAEPLEQPAPVEAVAPARMMWATSAPSNRSRSITNALDQTLSSAGATFTLTPSTLCSVARDRADVLALCGDLTDPGDPDEARGLARVLASAAFPSSPCSATTTTSRARWRR